MAEKYLPFISVIVPFYNIDECVEYCLDSLVAQDYEGEYEIVCVDDGSTDGTPEVLEAYASEHPRIHVLHKPNGGQSDARNFGIGHASGEYISFVDGDDVVSPYYLSALSDGLKFGKGAMVVGIDKKVNFNDVRSVAWRRPASAEEVSKARLIREICFQRILASVCFRLASKSLYENIPNPVDRIYEDTYITADHVSAVSKIALVNEPIYGYVGRDGSTVHPDVELMGNCLQRLEAIDNFCSSIEAYYPFGSDEQVVFRSIEYSRLWRQLDVVEDMPEQARRHQLEIERYVKQHIGQLVGSRDVSRGNKLRFILLANSPSVYRMAFSLYEKFARNF